MEETLEKVIKYVQPYVNHNLPALIMATKSKGRTSEKDLVRAAAKEVNNGAEFQRSYQEMFSGTKLKPVLRIALQEAMAHPGYQKKWSLNSYYYIIS